LLPFSLSLLQGTSRRSQRKKEQEGKWIAWLYRKNEKLSFQSKKKKKKRATRQHSIVLVISIFITFSNWGGSKPNVRKEIRMK